ncbi:MAG: hypothetical protein KAR19_10960 [Bacteroidales bacterium]|nr:hypothetical protein [Bacteroidales bacterium]
MNYINQFELIKAMLGHKSEGLDYKELLSTVNRPQIMKRIEKIELAYKSYFLLSDLDIDEQTTKLLGYEIIGYEMGGLRRKLRTHKRRK